MTSKKLCFGLKKSPATEHDHVVGFNYEKVDVPAKFSLKDRVKQVYDQGEMNSCSANATANLLSLTDKENKLNCNISRLYLYFCTRWLENNMVLPIQDNGASLRSVFNAFQYRYIDEAKYPYFRDMVNEIPYKHIFEEAFTNNSPKMSYRQIIPSKHSMKYILYSLKKPILFGMSVYSNFLDITKENDLLTIPTEKHEFLGFHAVVIVGYDDETESLDILNSHGLDWGNDGFFRMSYSYALNPSLAFEFYCVDV